MESTFLCCESNSRDCPLRWISGIQLQLSWVFHINNGVIFKRLIVVKSSYRFCFCVFLFWNLKNVVQIPIEDYVIYSLTWQ